MKKWVTSRTMWLGFGVGILGVIQATMETAPLDPQTAGFITMGIGVAIGVLRKLTTTPIG